MSTLSTIVKDAWEWRSQVYKLAKFELTKRTRGASLGKLWLFIRPAIYIFCFWFALEVGLRAGGGTARSSADVPYFLWLCAGLMPWFYIRDMISTGSDSLHRYSYLVRRIKFPISCIPLLYSVATMMVQLVLQAFLVVLYFAFGQPLDPCLIQVPILIILMFIFWTFVSLAFSLLSGMSRDFSQLLKAVNTPIFWISGVIFDTQNINIPAIKLLLDLNPVTFFVNAFRDAFYYRQWVWADMQSLVCFAIVFAATIAFALVLYAKMHEEVSDVL